MRQHLAAVRLRLDNLFIKQGIAERRGQHTDRMDGTQNAAAYLKRLPMARRKAAAVSFAAGLRGWLCGPPGG
jgi:hypothetical protein